MRASGHYRTGVITVRPDASVADVADRMDLHGVGCLVVVDEERGPVGIVTDRDLLRRVVAPGRDAGKTTAQDVMTSSLATASVDEPLERLIDRMGKHRVRRLPIMEKGRVVGLVSLDDLVAQMAAELGDIREAYRSGVLAGRRGAPRRRRRERLEELFEQVRSEAAERGASSIDWIQTELDALRNRLGRS